MVALAAYGTAESRKYLVDKKDKAMRKYHEEQQVLWANLTWSAQDNISARMYVDEVLAGLTDDKREQLREQVEEFYCSANVA